MSSAFRLDNITRRFGKVAALNGLSLTVRQGEVYGFLGRNGAGKTTTLRILMGIMRPDTGDIELLGQRVRRVSVALKQRIGYVSQEPSFYGWMTAVQLGRFVSSFYPRWDQQEFLRLLALLDVPQDRRASELSGGTKSKLGLALALAPRPELLLLDEPTAGLDPVARREFNDQLMALQRERGTTVFFSSHLVGEVEQLAQRVGIVQSGQTRFEGDISELRASVRRVVIDPQLQTPLPPGPELDSELSLQPNEPPRSQPVSTVMGEGFEQIRGDIYRADAAQWDATAWPEGTHVQQLPLEEIFLAFARTDKVVAP